MRTIIVLLILLAIGQTNLKAQRKLSIGLEMATGISEVTAPFGFRDDEGLRRASNLFLNGGLRINKKTEVTLGIGYLVTSDFEQHLFGFTDDVDFIEITSRHEYIVIPAGIRLTFGSFYLHPEIGLGIGNRHLINHNNFILDGNSASITGTSFESQAYRRFSQPLFLSFGNEIDLNSIKLLRGVKCYYSINDLSEILRPTGHYFGIGIVTGVKF